MPKLGDILNSINLTKDADLIDDYNKSDYVPFLINRGMSFFPDTILHSNEMNINSHLDRDLQYKYFLYSVRKKKRFSKWLSNKKPSENISLISEYYGISLSKAKSIADILSADDIKEIKNKLDTGGVRKNKNS
jgi:hypothetical protein